MNKIISLLLIIMFIIFSCSEPSEEHSFSHKKLIKTDGIKEFTTAGTYYWTSPDYEVMATITLIGGGGGGASGYIAENPPYQTYFEGGGGGASGDLVITKGKIAPLTNFLIINFAIILYMD